MKLVRRWSFFIGSSGGFWPVVLDPFFLGGTPPYFSSSCCVVLYLVAVFSLSIVLSRSFCKPSR